MMKGDVRFNVRAVDFIQVYYIFVQQDNFVVLEIISLNLSVFLFC